jgi:hypothetical protein
LSLYDEALQTRRAVQGLGHRQVAGLLARIGFTCLRAGLFDQAASSLQQCVDVYAKAECAPGSLERPLRGLVAALLGCGRTGDAVQAMRGWLAQHPGATSASGTGPGPGSSSAQQAALLQELQAVLNSHERSLVVPASGTGSEASPVAAVSAISTGIQLEAGSLSVELEGRAVDLFRQLEAIGRSC